MDVIVHQHPSMNRAFTVNNDLAEAFKKSRFILVVAEDIGSVDPSHHDVMHCAGSIEACLTWHAVSLYEFLSRVDQFALKASTSPLVLGCIEAGSAWHDGILSKAGGNIKQMA